MPDLIDVAEADARITALVRSMDAERVPLAAAHGRVLHEAVLADRDLPPFNRVMMDGYAIRRGTDNSVSDYQICGSALAGSRQQMLPADRAAALEVMTGAPLPEGADTVVPFEDTERDGDHFRVTDPDVETGQFIHAQASDQPQGTRLLEPGVQLRSVEIGIAASCGYAELCVAPQPRLSVFGTGDELVPVAQTPAPHQIRRSNAEVVAAALTSAGADVRTRGHLSDKVDHEQATLQEAILNSNIVVISGAVSKGRLDWIPGFLNKIGECRFHGVRQRPGKPMGVWKAESGAVIFALPGNPVSTLACTHRYIIPYLEACAGRSPALREVTLRESFSFDRPLTLFLPVRRDSTDGAIPAPVNNSGDYASLAATDGFIELPSTENHWTAGARARFTSWS